MLDRMQQSRFEVHQLRQFVGVPGIVLVITLVDVAYLPCVGYEYLVPAPLDHFRHPSRLPAGFDRYAAPPDPYQIPLQIRGLHRQPQRFHELPLLVQHANLAMLVPEVDAQVGGEKFLPIPLLWGLPSWSASSFYWYSSS